MNSFPRIRLLGPIAIEGTETASHESDSRKALALLGYLISQSRPMDRSHLAGLLWSECSESRGRRNLTRELARLVACLPSCLRTDLCTVGWAPKENLWLDTTAFLELTSKTTAQSARLSRTPQDRWFASPDIGEAEAAQLAEAVSLYRGEFMAGIYLNDCRQLEAWLLQEREYWQRRALAALDALSNYHGARRQYDQAQSYVQRRLALDPYSEDGHRHILTLLALAGERSAALSHYLTCRHLLFEELGVEPSRETVALYERIRRGELDPAPESRAAGRAAGDEREFRSQRQYDPGAREMAAASASDRDDVRGVEPLYGRIGELAVLQRWLIDEQCRLVIVCGIVGIGKTALASQLVATLANRFDVVLWSSLRRAPRLDVSLRGWLASLAAEQSDNSPTDLADQIELLLCLLRQRRCLIVLDDVEHIFAVGTRAGEYRPGYEAYRQLIACVAEADHRSCLLILSREQLHGYSLLAAQQARVRSLYLGGLPTQAACDLQDALGVSGAAAATLAERYSCNPLALKLAAETIRAFFGSDIQAFLHEHLLIFDELRDMLDQRFDTLPLVEQQLLFRLVLDQEPVPLQSLWFTLSDSESRRSILEAAQSLQRRSLLTTDTAGLVLDPMFAEYVTNRLIDQICGEIESNRPALLFSHPLKQPEDQNLSHAHQQRHVLQRIAERLSVRVGAIQLGQHLERLREEVHGQQSGAASYATANIRSLMALLPLSAMG